MKPRQFQNLANTHGVQSYFDYVAERLNVGLNPESRPEVLEFSGFETIEVGEIQTLRADAAPRLKDEVKP